MSYYVTIIDSNLKIANAKKEVIEELEDYGYEFSKDENGAIVDVYGYLNYNEDALDLFGKISDDIPADSYILFNGEGGETFAFVFDKDAGEFIERECYDFIEKVPIYAVLKDEKILGVFDSQSAAKALADEVSAKIIEGVIR